MILNSEFEIRNSKLILSSRAALPPFGDAELNEGSPARSLLSFRLWQGREKCRVQNAELRVDSLSISHLPKP